MIDLTSTVRGDLIAQVQRLEAEKVALTESLRIVTTDRNTIAATLDGAQGRESALKLRNDALLADVARLEELAESQRSIVVEGTRVVGDAESHLRMVIGERDKAREDLTDLGARMATLRSDREAYKAGLESLESSIAEAKRLLGATMPEGLVDLAARVAKDWREAAQLRRELESLRRNHADVCRRDAETRRDAAIFKAQMADRDSTIREIEHRLLTAQADEREEACKRIEALSLTGRASTMSDFYDAIRMERPWVEVAPGGTSTGGGA